MRSCASIGPVTYKRRGCVSFGSGGNFFIDITPILCYIAK